MSGAHREVVSGAGAGLSVQVLVVPGSELAGGVVVPGSVLAGGVVVVVVVVVSVLGGAVVVVVAGVEEVVVVEGATAGLVEFGPVVAPAVPAAATLGVVDWPSTVGSFCVWVRPGRGLGLAFGLVVAPAVCLAAVLSGDFLAVVAAFLAGAALCGCATGWVTAETPPVTCGVVVVATGCAGTEATTALDAAG